MGFGRTESRARTGLVLLNSLQMGAQCWALVLRAAERLPWNALSYAEVLAGDQRYRDLSRRGVPGEPRMGQIVQSGRSDARLDVVETDVPLDDL
jgi:hypothetical protein